MKMLELPVMQDVSTPGEALEEMIEKRRAGVVIRADDAYRLIEVNAAIDAVANKINNLANINRFTVIDIETGNVVRTAVVRTAQERMANLVKFDGGSGLANLAFDDSIEYLADRLENAVPVRRCSNQGAGPHYYPPTPKGVLIDPNTCWCGFKLI